MPNTFLRYILHEEGSFLHFRHLFMGITPLDVFIFYSHSKIKIKNPVHQLLFFGDMFLSSICLDFCKKPRNVYFDLDSVFSLSYKISFADLRPLLMEHITNI